MSFIANYLPLTGGTLTGNLTLPSAGILSWLSRSQISSPADGNILLQNNAGTGFTRLQFGGITSSSPSFGINGNSINVQLADGSNVAPINASLVQANVGHPIDAGGSTAYGFQITSALIGIYAGSGAPTISAAQGSIYLRSDGSTTTSRMYVNNSSGSGTTWTAVTTVA